jgi:hypothetical protein
MSLTTKFYQIFMIKISLRIPDLDAIVSTDPKPRQASIGQKRKKIKNFMFEQFSGGLGGFF